MKKLLFILITLTSFGMFAQTGNLQGVIQDKEYAGNPLPFADVYIKGTTKGATTDFDGNYLIENIDAGTLTLVISFVGYETKEIENVVIKDGETTYLNSELGADAAALQEIIIQTTTKKESEVALLQEQKKAIEIKQSIGAEELARKGVSNAAGAVAKITGVSKQEGSSDVYVRGLGDRYLNTTFNGLTIPSNDITKKNIDLGLFSSDVIENVSISKTYSPQFYGDFSAGNVNIKGKEQKGKDFFSIDVGTSINSRAVDKNFARSEGTGYWGYYTRYEHNPFAVIVSNGIDPEDVGTPVNVNFSTSAGKTFRFNNTSKLSLFATASFQNDFEYREGETRDFTVVERKAFPNVEEFVYSTTTTGLFNANYKIDDKNSLKFSSLFINSSESNVGNYGFRGEGRNRDAEQADRGFFQYSSKFKQDQIYVNQLHGEHNYDKWEIDWGIGYNVVNANEPDRKYISLENYQNTLDNDPNTNAEFFDNNIFDSQRYFQSIDDEEVSSFINFEYSFNDDLKVNFGYNGRYKERDFENIRYALVVPPTFEVSNATDFDSLFNVENLNNGLFETIAFNSIEPGISSTNNPGAPENTYRGVLRVSGAYVDAEYNVTDKLLVVPGLRFENINQFVEYDVINLTDRDPGFREADNTFLLPSLNVKYALDDQKNLRFAASRTISTPEFKEIAPYVYEDVTRREGGNPDLLNNPSFSEVFNVDLKLEAFLSRNELIAVTLFGKQINDPVNLVTAADATGTQRYFRTGDKATVLGIEIETKANILKNPNDDVILSGGFNFTYTDTEQDLKTVSGTFNTSFDRDSDELQGASKILFNADLNYTPTFGNYKPKANLVFGYKSDSIFALGAGTLGNVVEQEYESLDFILKNNITENLSLNMSIKNILDPAVQYVREGANTDGSDIIVSTYKRGLDFSLQLKYKF